MCTLEELRKEVAYLKQNFQSLVKIDAEKIE
jgi:hypothetical protein